MGRGPKLFPSYIYVGEKTAYIVYGITPKISVGVTKSLPWPLTLTLLNTGIYRILKLTFAATCSSLEQRQNFIDSSSDTTYCLFSFNLGEGILKYENTKSRTHVIKEISLSYLRFYWFYSSHLNHSVNKLQALFTIIYNPVKVNSNFS